MQISFKQPSNTNIRFKDKFTSRSESVAEEKAASLNKDGYKTGIVHPAPDKYWIITNSWDSGDNEYLDNYIRDGVYMKISGEDKPALQARVKQNKNKIRELMSIVGEFPMIN